MKIAFVTGKTYDYRDSLKKDGFHWNPDKKAWSKKGEDEDVNFDALIEAYRENGLSVDIKVTTPDVPKYFVKESWIFNLESMHDKIHCLSYDIRDGKIELPFTVAGKTIKNEDDLWALLDEAEELECRAKHGKVTGKQYGRIKAIVSWRVEARYVACMNAGMEESEAGKCFEDM